MRQLLIASMAPVLWILTVLDGFFIRRMFLQYAQKKRAISLIVAVMCIGLFYDYYMFQYATGYSAAAAIADRILREGAPAVADYKKFLSSGSSADPISLLRIAGVDMSTPAPVNSALELFGELVEELEKLAD